MTAISFWVPGTPAPQGSKKYMGRKGGKGIMLESSKRTAPWRSDVRDAGEKALAQCMEAGEDLRELWSAPLHASCVFLFTRPKSHFGTGKNSDKLKMDAPVYPMAKNLGDIEKLARAVFDALTGILYEDDKQVASANLAKMFHGTGEGPGMRITLASMLG